MSVLKRQCQRRRSTWMNMVPSGLLIHEFMAGLLGESLEIAQRTGVGS